MALNRIWVLPLALLGGMAVGAAFMLDRRRQHRHGEKRQHKENLQSWEGEGGGLVTPEIAQQPS